MCLCLDVNFNCCSKFGLIHTHKEPTWLLWSFSRFPHRFPQCPPTHREILKKGQVCPYTFCCYINGWCFLDLKWTFYRALLPIYIKKDSGVFVTHLARAAILTDSCQVFVLQLYLCNDSVVIILYYDHCPAAMYLICSDCFVVISTNEILDLPDP